MSAPLLSPVVRHLALRSALTLGIAAVACGGAPQPASDRARYLAVVSDKDSPAGELLAACEPIGDPVLSGDCALHVVMTEARRPAGQPGALCARVPEGLWRAECWFVTAEHARKRQDVETAAAACGQAGPFAADCAQHLWQGEVHRLIHRAGAGAFAQKLPAARKIHARWSALFEGMDELGSFDQRFWAKFYQNGFEGQGSFVDLDACDVLGDDDAARCVDAGVEMYLRELGPRMDQWRLDLCAESAWTSASLARYVPARPDPRLDAALDGLRSERCGD